MAATDKETDREIYELKFLEIILDYKKNNKINVEAEELEKDIREYKEIKGHDEILASILEQLLNEDENIIHVLKIKK